MKLTEERKMDNACTESKSYKIENSLKRCSTELDNLETTIGVIENGSTLAKEAKSEAPPPKPRRSIANLVETLPSDLSNISDRILSTNETLRKLLI
ncbi:MAG: hypothetical protein ACE5GN_03035 [Waddliaceae bacterium]